MEAIVQDYRQVELDAVDRAVLDYSVKLTCTPGQVSAQDVQTLRQAGLNDRAIHDLCAVVAYFAFVNRIADGLGVQLENDKVEPE